MFFEIKKNPDIKVKYVYNFRKENMMKMKI